MANRPTLRKVVARKGPLADHDLARLARDLSARARDGWRAFSPDAVRREEDGRWSVGGAPAELPAEEGWDSFEAAAGKARPESAAYRMGAVLLFAATGKPPSSAGLPFQYVEPPAVGVRAFGVREALRGLLDPSWRERLKDPLEAARLIQSSAPAPAARYKPAPSGSPSFMFGVALASIFASVGWALYTLPRLGPGNERIPIARVVPGLAPRKEPAMPFPKGEYADAATAVRALLSPGLPSGDIARVVVSGQERVFVRGHQVFPDGAGCTDGQGSAMFQEGYGSWVLAGPEGKTTALPKFPSAMDTMHCLLDRSGRPWVYGRYRGGILRLDSGAWTKVAPLPELEDPATSIEEMLQDGRGRIWAAFSPRYESGRDKATLAVLEGGRWTGFGKGAGLDSIAAHTVLPLPGGGALVGKVRGMALVDGGRRAAFGNVDGLQRTPDRMTLDAVNGRLLLVHDDGFTVADAQGFRRRYTRSDGLPDSFRDAGVDAQGRTWVFGDRVLVLPKGAL